MKRILLFLFSLLTKQLITLRLLVVPQSFIKNTGFLAVFCVVFSSNIYAQTGSQTFTSGGNFTVPDGVTSITVQAWGGGGGGSTRTSSGRGGGGGGGAFVSSVITSADIVGFAPGQVYVVGIGGGGGANTAGGNSTFNGATVVAAGGSGGTSNSATAGLGGTTAASTGETEFRGGNGAAGGVTYSGGGGGGAGSGGNGGDAPVAALNSRGTGTATNGGNGGQSVSGSTDGLSGANYGAGGSGAVRTGGTRTGGSGTPGLVVITWNCPTATISYPTDPFCIADGVQSVSITGSTGGTFSSSIGLTLNASTGDITPSSSSAGTYTVTYQISGSGGCSNVSTNASVTVYTNPSAPTGTSNSRCGTGTVALSATPGGGETIDWYDAASGGTLLLSGNVNYTTPSIATTTTYYAESRNTTSGCVSTTRTAVTATVNNIPAISVQPTTPAATCTGTGSQVISVTATGTGLSYSWRRATVAVVNGGVISGQGSNTLTLTAPLAANAGSYDVVVSGTCPSPVTSSAVTVTVNANNTVGAASSTPTLCINTVLTNITHSTTGATGIGVATGLPAGVSAAWAANTITISGTPSASGTFNYSIPLTGGCSSVNATGTITVTPANTASAASATPTLCINTLLTNITHTTTGATGITNSGVSGANGLPTGVSAAWAGNTITISGTPSASGTFNYSIPMTGGCGSVNATGTITITPLNTVGAASSTPTLCINTLLTNITHSTTGATGVANSGVSGANGLPTGVSATWAANTVTISGTPSAAGTFNYSIALTGGCGSFNATGTITVTAANTPGSASSTPTLCINTLLTNITRTTTGATGISNSGVSGANGLPAGVSAAWAANVITISGTPSASGTFNYSIPMTGGCGAVNATGTITVTPANIAAAASSTPTLCINTLLTNITHTTTGATGITNSGVSGANGLPTGVSAAWAGNTITISGTPSASGTFNYSIPMTGGCGSVNATGTITITPLNTVGAASSTPTLCINTLLTNITHSTTGATGVANSGVSGANGLPTGVSATWAANTVTISGTPSAAGTFNYSIALTGGCGSFNATGTITVTAANTPGSASSTPTLCINTLLTNITRTTTGATGISNSGVSGANGLPAGVSAAWAANVITISGTPSASGTFNYSIPLTGGCGSVNATGTITVTPANTPGSASSTPTLCINTVLTNITRTTTGATGISNSGVSGANGLPAGVSAAWAANTITISGTPSASGTFNYSIPLTGGCGSVNATGTITVTPTNTVGAASSTPTLCISTALTNITHSTTGATGVSNSGVSGANGLPAGVSAAWAANTITISGTPSASGTFNYSIPLTGGCGTVNATGTITVTPNMTAATGSSTPTLCINTALTNITHTTTLATGISNSGVSGANGLPTGVSAAWAANTITISGTPTASGTFSYSIPLTGGCGSINATGTITVNAVTAISVQPTTPTTTCSGSGTQSMSVTAVGGSLTYSWRRGGIAVVNGGVISGQGTATLTLTNATAANAGSYDVIVSGACGTSVTSSAVTVSINALPAISVQPTTPAATCSGTGTQIMSVTATGTGLTYSWRKGGIAVVDGSIISGQGTNTLTLTNPLLAEAGSWDVIVGGTCTPSVTSSAVTVTVNTAPNITIQPVTPTSTCDGTGVQSMSVTATGAGLTYSWRKGGIALVNGGVVSGQGTATLTLTGPALADAGSYDIVISGTCTPSATSSAVTVTVKTIPTITATTPGERCQTGTVNLDATPSAGTINWYAATTGGSSLGSGNSFATPSIAVNTNYYIDATSNGCTTLSRTAVLATVWALPTTSNAGANINNCNNSTFTMAGNVPVIGTGLWTVSFGSATIVTPASATSSTTGVPTGAAATLTWTISNGTCPVSTDNVTIRNFAPATVSNAGPAQAQCASGNFTLAANNPTVGSGQWSLTSGTATITDVFSNVSTVTGVPAGTSATLTWTITNGTCTSTSTVTLSNDIAPTVSNAETNISQCNTSAFTLAANAPTVGTGLWSVVSGAASITTPSSRTSAATLAVGLSSTIQWTISNGSCPVSSSTIVLTNSQPATVSNAGVAQFNCNSGSFTLAGNSPVVGTGLWSVNSGTATITTPSLRTSGVTGVPAGTAPVLTWTITNGACSSASNVTLTNYALPTTSVAYASSDIYNCNSTVFTMAANTPVVGTGNWTVVSGSATITTPSSPTSAVTLTSGIVARLRWTISNGTCTPSTSDVVINNVIIAATVSGTNITCPRGTDGTVTLTTPTGGLAPYTYLWNSLVTTQNLTGVPAGNYQCVITDSRGCKKNMLQTLTQPADIDTTVVMVNTTCGACPDGSLTVTGAGGTPGYTYLWSNGTTSQTRSGLLKGTYPITITDSRGCPATFNIILLGPVSADIIATSSCLPNQGFASVIGIGGHPPYTYLWSTGSTATTVTNLPTGNISCTVTDNTSNTYTQTSKITNADYSTVSASPATTSICPGASVNITSANAQNPVWSPATGLSSTTISNPVATPATSTIYTLQVTQPTPTLVTNGNFSSGNTGFYSDYGYVSPAANTAAGNAGLWPEGYYAVGTNPFTYHPNWTVLGDHTTGSGNMMILNGAPVSGAEVWSQQIGVINQNTNYSFSTWITSVHPSNVAQLRFSINGVLQGTTISPSATPGTWTQFTTTWNSGTALVADVAIVNINTVLGGNDFALDDISFTTTCTNSSVATVDITVNQPPTVSVHPSNTIGCTGQSTSFSVTAAGAGLTYRWQISTNNGSTWSNLSNGGVYSNVTATTLNISSATGLNNFRYRVVITGTCSPTATSNAAILTVNTPPTITATTPGSNCGTGTVSLGATGSAGTLNWYTASSGGSSLGTGSPFTTPSISSTTTYYVDATNAGCLSARSAVVATINTVPTITSSAGSSRCSTGSLTITASPSAGTVNWYAASSGGSSLGSGTSFATPSISVTTTYYAEASSAGCSSTPRVGVVATINAPPSVSVPPPNTAVCMGNNTSFTLTASGVSPTYQWQLSTNNGGSFANITNGGVYSNATTVTLNITGALLSMDAYQYRCVVSSSGCTSTNSNAGILSVHNPGLGLSGYSPVSGDYFWTGLSTIAWGTLNNWLYYNGTNWSIPGSLLPAITNNVYIRAGGVSNACISGANQPTQSATAYAQDLFIETGAILTVSGSPVLNVSGNWTNEGSFLPATGTVQFTSTGNQTITTNGITVGKQFYDISIKTPNDRRLIVPSGHEMKVLNNVTVQP